MTGEGHAHVYINEKKVARVYSPWFHLDQVAAGMNKVTVTLNTNDHQQIALDGRPLSASTMIEAGEEK